MFLQKSKLLISLFGLCLFLNFKSVAEPIKIVEIVDTNIFRTEADELISLANVKSYSIHDPDSLKCNFARDVHPKLQRLLLNRQFELENVNTEAVPRTVLLWRINRIGKTFINAHYLEKGLGEFVEGGNHPYLKKLKWLSARAKMRPTDQYSIKEKSPKIPLGPNASWVSAGIGFSGDGWQKRRKQDLYHLSTSLGYRYKLIYSDIGALYHGNGVTSVRSYYFSSGISLHDRIGEATLSVGPSRSSWSYNTETERGTIKSDQVWGTMVKIQGLIHAPQGLGMGIAVAGEFKGKWVTYSMTFSLHLGVWNE